MGLKSLVGALLIAATTALHSGCAYKCTFGEEKHEERRFYPSVSAELSFKQGMYFVNAGKKIQTTQAHPEDYTILSGEAKTNIHFGYEIFTPKLGLEGALGSKDIRIRIGADARLSLLSKTPYHNALNGIYDTRKQQTGPWPLRDYYGTVRDDPFIFTSIGPDFLTYTPYVGLEARLTNSVFLTADVGVPFAKFKARSGHDRWGEWETVQRDSWSGIGFKIGGSIGIAPRGNLHFLKSISLVVDYEHYSPKFAGEKAEVNAIFFGLKFERWGWEGFIFEDEPTRYDSHGYN